jgi:beta-lactamase regulating signal transducer with metallopeptidase domain
MPRVVGLWSAGAILLGLWRLVGWLAVGRLCRRGVRPAPAELQALLDRLTERMPIHPTVRLLESTLATVPAVVGALRPVILLPVGIVTGLSPHELELILAHELAHIRRWDYLANLTQSAIETCLFYHPAVWWVSRCIRVERERCCDDAVVKTTGARMFYARTLTRLAELRSDRRAPRPAVAADDGSLLDRIRRILGLPDEQRRWATARLVGGGAAMSIVAGLVGFAALAEPAPHRPLSNRRCPSIRR